jgi:hypothetical protein
MPQPPQLFTSEVTPIHMPLHGSSPLAHAHRPLAEQVWPGTEQLVSPRHCTQRLVVVVQYGALGPQSPLVLH